MQAVFLSFLPPPQAGSVIENLPAQDRDHLLIAMARLQEIDNELLTELDEIVSRCLDEMGTQSAAVEGTRQVAEILNRLPGDKRQMLESLRVHDAELVSKIEASMYDFFILSNQTETVLTRLLEEVPLEQWAIALKGAEPSIRDAILQTMPKRQAQSFQDILRRAGPVPMSRVEQTRKEIMAQVKALADAGEIEIQLFAEATVE
jgi:flagellar motor switch protein FliG